MKLFLDGPERECERLALEFAATEKQIQAASRRAVSKLGRWMRSAILRESSRDTGMPRKALKGRLKMSEDRVAASTRVWVGRNAIPLSALNPRQTRSGVTAGPVQRRHAFMLPGRRGPVFKREGRSRLPISVQYEDISKDIERVLQTEIYAEAERKFLHFFRQELRWEKVKEGRS
ncbi:hypothetical protein [Desulfobaculum bizertense]|uniref:Prophage minor tail protein Z (GPZ) n=1 Tax=Desulfobaculum bizertense DSM 18034 TaxID=1121442 RepID=A0A1T4W1A9_9BACT|nr:hypothetical protein [Desulfobaculum bizertense]SKA70828.1 hypothetical protein SAMN02745702_01343 [Desulfobaculum bizertense DSM 18034]